MKIFDVTSPWDSTAQMCVNRWSGMSRERNMMRLNKSGRFEKSAEPRTACCIHLKDVNGAGLEHPPEISGVVAVFARGDIHAGGRMVTNQRKTFEVIRRHRFFKPAHIVCGKQLCEFERL